MILLPTFASSIAISTLVSVAVARRREGIPPHSSHWNATNFSDLAKYCETAEDTYIVMHGVLESFPDKVAVDFGSSCAGIAGPLDCAELKTSLNVCRENEMKILLEVDYTEPDSVESAAAFAKKIADLFLIPDSPQLVFPVQGFLTGKTMVDENIKSLIRSTQELRKLNKKINPIIAVNREGPYDQHALLHEPGLNIKAVFLNLYGTPPNRVKTSDLPIAGQLWAVLLNKGFKIELNLVDVDHSDTEAVLISMDQAQAKYLKYEIGSLEYLEKVETDLKAYQDKKALEEESSLEEANVVATSSANPANVSQVVIPTTVAEITTTKISQNLTVVTTTETRTSTETRFAASTIEQCQKNGSCHISTATSTYVIQIEICAARPINCIACQPQEEKIFKCLEGDCPADEIRPVTTSTERLLANNGKPTQAPNRKGPIVTKYLQPHGRLSEIVPDKTGVRSARAAQSHDGELPDGAQSHDGKLPDGAQLHEGARGAYSPSTEVDTTIQVTSYVIVRASSTDVCTVDGVVNTCIATKPIKAASHPKSSSTGPVSSITAPSAKPTFEVFEGAASKFTISVLFAGAFFFVALA